MRRRYFFILRGVALAAMLMLAPDRTRSSATAGATPGGADATVITLERTGCFGPCPIYRVTLQGDGTVIFEGKRFVKSTGTFTAHVAPEQVRRLVEDFKKVDYFSLRDKYVTRADGCQEWWTDNPSAITSLKVEGKQKS